MFTITAGDHAATRFDTMREFTENTVVFTHRALAHDAQVMIFPTARELDTTQRLVTDAGADIWRAVGAGQVRFTDPQAVQLALGRFDPDYLRQAYAAATSAAIDNGYSGLWVSVDMTWAKSPFADPDALIAFEAGSFPLFHSRQLTALCQYHTAHFAMTHIRQACQAHPVTPGGVRLAHQLSGDGRLLRLSGETDMANSTAFATLVAAVPDGAAIDTTPMKFLDVAALAQLAAATRPGRDISLMCTPVQAGYLRTVGAEATRIVTAAGRQSARPAP